MSYLTLIKVEPADNYEATTHCSTWVAALVAACEPLRHYGGNVTRTATEEEERAAAAQGSLGTEAILASAAVPVEAGEDGDWAPALLLVTKERNPLPDLGPVFVFYSAAALVGPVGVALEEILRAARESEE